MVGYQRPAFMSGKLLHALVKGLYMLARDRPTKSDDVAAGYEEPAVSQERVAAAEDVVTRLAEDRHALVGGIPGRRRRITPPSPPSPLPGQIITFPVGSMWVWTGK